MAMRAGLGQAPPQAAQLSPNYVDYRALSDQWVRDNIPVPYHQTWQETPGDREMAPDWRGTGGGGATLSLPTISNLRTFRVSPQWDYGDAGREMGPNPWEGQGGEGSVEGAQAKWYHDNQDKLGFVLQANKSRAQAKADAVKGVVSAILALGGLGIATGWGAAGTAGAGTATGGSAVTAGGAAGGSGGAAAGGGGATTGTMSSQLGQGAFMSGSTQLGSGISTLGGTGATVGVTGGTTAGVTGAGATSAGLGAGYGGLGSAWSTSPALSSLPSVPSASSLETQPAMTVPQYEGLQSIGSNVQPAQSLGYQGYSMPAAEPSLAAAPGVAPGATTAAPRDTWDLDAGEGSGSGGGEPNTPTTFGQRAAGYYDNARTAARGVEVNAPGGTIGSYFAGFNPNSGVGLGSRARTILPLVKAGLGAYQNWQAQNAVEDEIKKRKELYDLQMQALTDPMSVPGLAQQARYANQLYSNQYRALHGGTQGGAYSKGLAKYVNNVVQQGANQYANTVGGAIGNTNPALMYNMQAGGTRAGAVAGPLVGAMDDYLFNSWLNSI